MNQHDLEREMAVSGSHRYQSKLNRARGKFESQTKGGQKLLQHTITYFEEGIVEWIKQARGRCGRRHGALKHLRLLPPNLVAALAARTIIDCLASSNRLTRVAIRIGMHLEDEAYLREFERQNAESFRLARNRVRASNCSYSIARRWARAQGRVANIEWDAWTTEDRVRVGAVLVEVFCRSTGLVQIVTTYERRKSINKIEPTEIGLKALNHAHAASELMTPLYLPCVEEPRPWVSPTQGGYLSPELYKRALVKTSRHRYLRDLESRDMPEVYRALNAMQTTPFCINHDVFQVFAHAFHSGAPLPDIPDKYDLPLPERPTDETDIAAKARYRKEARSIYALNRKTRSQRLTNAKLYNVGQRFLGGPIWFVQQCDFRGRVYPTSYFLQPQGSDLCKALCSFAKPKPIQTDEAIFFYYVHGANAWGLDKASFDDRVAWVRDNADLIQRIAKDPWENRHWHEADQPWVFLAWAMDFTKWVQDSTHESGVVIAQDATQSGIQILSMLLRDEVGAAATNCTPADQPEDLYRKVAECCLGLIQQEVGGPDDLIARFWIDFGVDRGAAKRPTMTRAYNATQFSARDYVAQWFQDQMASRGVRPGQILPAPWRFETASTWLADRMWAALNTVTRSSQAVMEWLGQIADLFSEAAQPIRWVVPTNFLVEQHYTKSRHTEVTTKLGRKIRYLSLQKDTEEVSARHNRQALAPNVIHSLDAAAMMRTVNFALSSGVESFSMIHDSYGTVAADAHLIYSATREAFVDMFEADILADLSRQFSEQLPGVSIPELPPYGALDIRSILTSHYFFC